MNQKKSNSLKSRTEYVRKGVVYVRRPAINDREMDVCLGCAFYDEEDGCTAMDGPNCDGIIFVLKTEVDLLDRISILLDTASFETEGDVTTAYIPLHYSGIMDDVLEMMSIKATMGTFKEKSSFLRAYNIHTSDFKRICEKH